MQKKKTFAPLGAGFVIISSLAYGSYGVWVKFIGNVFGDFTLAVLRGALVVLLLLPFAIWQKQLTKIHWSRDKWILLWLIISTVFISAPFYFSVRIIGVSLSTGILYAGIILGTMFFGKLIGNETYTKIKWISTIFGIAGLVLIFAPKITTLSLLGMLAALASGLGSGLDYVTVKYLNYSTQQSTIMTWSATVITNLPFLFFIKEPLPAIELNIHWFYFFIFAVISLIASWFLTKGLKLVDAGTVGILGLLEIVFGVMFGVIIFHEQPTLLAIAGMFCIILASALPYLQHYKNHEH